MDFRYFKYCVVWFHSLNLILNPFHPYIFISDTFENSSKNSG